MSKHERRALGRGLANLIPTEADEPRSDGDDISQVDTNAIYPNPFQPRTTFAQEEIDGLARSIEAQGLLQPILVRKKVDGYEIVSGERRFRAIRQLGWDRVPCIVKVKVSDREMLELALVENLQRQDLNPIEEALAYQKLLVECSLSHDELAKRVGKSRSLITNTLRLLKLPATIQKLIGERTVSAGHARALLAIDDPARQKEIVEKIASQGISVREVEAMTKIQSKTSASDPTAAAVPVHHAVDPDIAHQTEQLQYRFGTAVRIITAKKGGGTLQIRFNDDADLHRIMELLMGGR